GVLSAVRDADHIALLSWAGPHHILRLSGPLLGVSDVLTPAAREALWSGAARPDLLHAALTELSEVICPGWIAAWAGQPLSVLAGGEDLLSVDAAIKGCLGLEGLSVSTTGLDPELVRREATSARSALPEEPDRYPGVDGSLCTRCDACTQVCPTGAVTLPDKESQPVTFDYNACLRCGICVTACPDFAIAPSVRPMGAKLVEVVGLVLPVQAPDATEREAAVPMAAAMELGPASIDAPPRRPAWLEGYVAPDRHQRDRDRERHPEALATRRVLDRDGAVRLLIAPSWGIRGNRTSLGIAYLAGTLDADGQPYYVVDLAHEMRSCDPVLHEALSVLGDPKPNGGVYGPEVDLLLQVVAPEEWEDGCPLLARQIHESAGRDAQRITDPGALHGLIVADSNVTYAFALGAAIRRMGGRVVLGGPTMSHGPTAELALRAEVADAVVVGEGEAAILALAKAQREDTWESLTEVPIPGLVLWDGDRVLRQANFRNRALDALPFPDWEGQEHPPEFIPILAARGCVTKCSFCSEQTISPKFAQRSVEDVLTEMDLLHESTGQTRFEFNDDLLNGNMKWLLEFCHTLVDRGTPYQWQGLCRPHRLDYEILKLMRDAGCVQMTYGVQHFSWNMLKVMGRKEEPDPLLQVLDDTLSLGMLMYIDVIIGHPGETEEDFDITVSVVRDLMLRYPNIAINLNPFNYIYGSAVDLFPDRYGVTAERFSADLPERFSHLSDLASKYVVDYQQEPDQETVIDRVNRLAWTVFQTRMPPKIPILDEELPFCNDNCLHCGVAEIMKTANVVPLPQIVASLHELAPRSGGRVMFAVSELTIRPDFVQIIQASRRAQMKTIALVTNGRMFAYPAFTKRTVDAGLTHALVSVYGPTARIHQAITRTPKSFEQTIAGLRDLLAYPQVTVMTNSVITKKNYRYLAQMVELLAGLGVKNVNLSFVQIIGAADRYSEPLVPRIRDVLPYLREAVDLGVELGLNMGIGGLPYCVLKGYEQHFGVDDLTTIANSDEADNITSRSPYTQADACKRCAYNAVCLGMQEEYLARYGEEELDPYHGRRLERRPDSEIVRAMFPDMQYTDRGLPSSLFANSQPAGLATMTVSGAAHSGQG
ncbi:MAG: radical SAM protein, partial [Myxococcota bacterium]|nr:radical SAM protein [Myxococcota bacterium]